jgi:CheY-like chemotaxis protein
VSDPSAPLALNVDGAHDAAAERAHAAPPLAGLNVLVVEDEPDTRELVALILQYAGARVTAAGSAAEALAAIVRGPVDCVIADLSLPDDDGHALVRRLREAAGRTVRVIAFTGWVRAEDEQRARAAGFDAYVRKPAEPGDLVDLVRAMARPA